MAGYRSSHLCAPSTSMFNIIISMSEGMASPANDKDETHSATHASDARRTNFERMSPPEWMARQWRAKQAF